MAERDAALIVIDVQDKLFRLMHQRQELLERLQRLIRGARALELPVVWAEQYPEGMGATVAEVAALLDGAPIPKKTFSCWAHPPLRRAIRATGADRFVLAGIETHVCVFQTARDLLAAGHRVEVAGDCVSSRTETDRRLGLERIAQHGGHWTGVEMLLFDLLGSAEDAAFKQVLPIVK